ncbi:MAG: hypothetical protein ABI664_18200, partial [bacterium]
MLRTHAADVAAGGKSGSFVASYSSGSGSATNAFAARDRPSSAGNRRNHDDNSNSYYDCYDCSSTSSTSRDWMGPEVMFGWA